MILVPNPFLSFFLPAYSLFFSLCREKKRKGSKFLWKKKKNRGEGRGEQKPTETLSTLVFFFTFYDYRLYGPQSKYKKKKKRFRGIGSPSRIIMAGSTVYPPE